MSAKTETGRLLEDAFEVLPDAVLLADATGCVLRANERARALFGSEVIGRDLSRVILDLAPGSGCDWGAIGAGQIEVARFEGAGGRQFAARFSGSFDADGRRTGTVAVVADVTALGRLERAFAAGLDFLGHDLRSPLVSLLALLDLCELAPDQKPPDFEARVRRFTSSVLEAAENFVRMADADAWDGAGMAPVSLTDAVQDAVDAVWSVAKERRIRLVFVPPAGEAGVHGNRSRLAHLAEGLITCALRRTSPGETVSCELTRAGKRWRLRVVRPSGPAGEDENLRRQLEAAGRSGARGQAHLRAEVFPLALAKLIAEKHGGSMTLEHATAGAAVFSVELPAL